MQEKAATQPPTSLPLSAFTGTYTNEFYGQITLEQKGEALAIQFEQHPSMTASLQHLGEDVFLCTYSDHLMGIMEVPFTIADGKVQNLDLRVADFVEPSVYNFSKN